MRRYLLDTGPAAAFLLGRPGARSLLAPWLTNHEVATSVLVYGEVIEYFKMFRDFPTHRAALRTMLREVRAYTPTYAIVERYADIRLFLRRRSPGLIGDVDTLIAATALVHGLTEVTVDSDFQRIPDLEVYVVSKEALRTSP